MKMLPKIDYKCPISLVEASQLLQSEGTVALAGGTDLLVKLRERKYEPQCVVDLKKILELSRIEKTEEGLFIGSMATMDAIYNNTLLADYTALRQGVKAVGCHEIRQRATLGGNVCNASPGGDGTIALLLYNPVAVIASAHEERRIPLKDFFKGYGKTDLEKGEILKGFLLSNDPGFSQFRRTARVEGMDLASCSLGMRVVDSAGSKQVYISAGAVLPKPARIEKLEKHFEVKGFEKDACEEALCILNDEIDPRKDSLRATPWYKGEMVAYFLAEILELYNES